MGALSVLLCTFLAKCWNCRLIAAHVRYTA
jgi:hypothetical protein